MTDIEKVLKTICRNRCWDYEDIMSTRQSLDLWKCRYMIWYYLHYGMGISSGRIAAYFARNRGSIFRGIRLMKHELKYNKDVRDEYYKLCKATKGATDKAAPPEI